MTHIHVERDRGADNAPVHVVLADGSLHVSVCLTDEEANDLGCRLAAVADQERLVEGDGHDDGPDRPRRSEPADFGGGESTGVQDLL